MEEREASGCVLYVAKKAESGLGSGGGGGTFGIAAPITGGLKAGICGMTCGGVGGPMIGGYCVPGSARTCDGTFCGITGAGAEEPKSGVWIPGILILARSSPLPPVIR